MKITWKHSDSDFGSPLSFDDKITIFRERIWGWHLHIAELCINGGDIHDKSIRVQPIPHSGYAVLSITLSYFETIGKHLEGYTDRFESEKHFGIGVRAVFPELTSDTTTDVDALLSAMYKGMRCGLYHSTQAMPGIYLSGEPGAALTYDRVHKQLLINPHLIPKTLVDHLDAYCAQLRNGTDTRLRRNFDERFDYELTGKSG